MTRHHRVEVLAEDLVRFMSVGGDPFTPERILFQSPGMERWLAMELASRIGVHAQVRFSSPATFVGEVLVSVIPEAAEVPALWEPGRLAWVILRLLDSELLQDADVSEVRHYLEGDQEEAGPGTRRRVLLARKLGDLFGRYLEWRPDLLDAWRTRLPDDNPERWQAVLWRGMCEALGDLSPAALRARLLHGLQTATARPAGLPRRVALFGLSSLAPSSLDVLQALSRLTEVRVYLLAPSRSAWEPQEARRGRNPLLTALGRCGGELSLALDARFGSVPARDDAEETATTALAILQRDVLCDVDRGARGGPPPMTLAPNDGSVTFHSCHGPMRQLQVLRDELLRSLANDPSLQPRDIVIMCPDIEAMAPGIEAVFGAGEPASGENRGWEPSGFPRIQYRISDLTIRSECAVAEALMRILGLPGARVTAAEVLDLLSIEPVRRRFGLEETDVPAAREWVAQAGIRWGRDAAHREQEGRLHDDLFTWRFGLDRLLLGLSFDGHLSHTWANVLPVDDLESGDAIHVVRGLVELGETLLEELAQLEHPRSPAEWLAKLSQLLDKTTRPDPRAAWSLARVKRELGETLQAAGDAGFEGLLTLAGVRELLEGRFQSVRSSPAFKAGGITFCSLTPMRSIPFAVVALLGMDDDAFPRRPRRLAFDLMARDRRPGDREPRDDDRYLFLEALLAARQRLLVLWSGRDPRDNKPRPAATPVLELLDRMSASFRRDGAPDDATMRQGLVTAHPLQPFSPRAFGGEQGPLISYDRTMAAAAKVAAQPRTEPPALFARGGLPVAPSAGGRVLRLNDLRKWLTSPTRELLKERLGMRFADDLTAVKTEDPLLTKGLDLYAIGDAALSARLAGGPMDGLVAAALRSAKVALGTAGERAVAGAVTEAVEIAEATLAFRKGSPPETLDVDIELGPTGDSVRLVGRLNSMSPYGRVVGKFSRLTADKLLNEWVQHLAMSVQDPNRGLRTVVVGRALEGADVAVVEFGPLGDTPSAREEKARRLLSDLVAIQGAAQQVPLAFSPEAAAIWVAEPDRQLTESAFDRDYAGRTCPYVGRVWGDESLFVEPEVLGVSWTDELRFEALAERIWRPLKDHLRLNAGGSPS